MTQKEFDDVIVSIKAERQKELDPIEELMIESEGTIGKLKIEISKLKTRLEESRAYYTALLHARKKVNTKYSEKIRQFAVDNPVTHFEKFEND